MHFYDCRTEKKALSNAFKNDAFNLENAVINLLNEKKSSSLSGIHEKRFLYIHKLEPRLGLKAEPVAV